jgi:bile acid:Na+ symporter, BASS family
VPAGYRVLMVNQPLKNLWRNRDAILFLALLLGLSVGQLAVYTDKMVLPALGLVMTLSVLGVPSEIFRSPQAFVRPAVAATACSFLLLGGLLMGLSRLFIQDQELRQGFVILAAVPPAVAVIPFTGLLQGDQVFSLLGTIGSYLAALILTPLFALFLLGDGMLVPPHAVAVIVGELILLPLVLSRLLHRFGYAEKIEPYKGAMTNWSFFVITYTIVGLNRQLFLAQPLSLLPVVFIAVCSTFLWGEIIERFCRWRGLEQPLTISLILLGTLKNYGLSGGLALALFSTQTSVPSAVSTVFMIVYIIWLNAKRKWVWSNPPELANF